MLLPRYHCDCNSNDPPNFAISAIAFNFNGLNFSIDRFTYFLIPVLKHWHLLLANCPTQIHCRSGERLSLGENIVRQTLLFLYYTIVVTPGPLKLRSNVLSTRLATRSLNKSGYVRHNAKDNTPQKSYAKSTTLSKLYGVPCVSLSENQMFFRSSGRGRGKRTPFFLLQKFTNRRSKLIALDTVLVLNENQSRVNNLSEAEKKNEIFSLPSTN